ncbi:amidohydrolase 2 [Pirellula staleyi DSM 6068]|uniref:Amidohydrolase 2 n=1 Tax=Pirellula staleyi (strain ATCC 27377 / DSM 6068 / ICPB 4128) TaxID=530564 RepID=D2R7C6_PIRSD|nr:amidohydrolase family protein [Pirellula staleyi]ADB15622.1 amidohydrolase 2 [Pirellula staleyi DSM 6068]
MPLDPSLRAIDAHQHFWDLGTTFYYDWLRSDDKQPICKNRLPADLAPLMREAGVARCITVQTQHNVAENVWADSLAHDNDFIAGVVGWVDLQSDDVEAQLIEAKQLGSLVGIRHVVQDEPDDQWLLRENVLRGLAVLERHAVPYDLLLYVKHLPLVPTLAARFPSLKLVINHLAKPEIKLGRLDNWEPHLRAAARFPNVYCKLSGMVTEADWTAWKPADLRPYVQVALDAFSPARCMFGSDWPVCELAASYSQVVDSLIESLGPISPSETEQIFRTTAEGFYGIA